MVKYFTGSFIHRVDAKGRVSLPASYRKVLEGYSSSHVIVIPRCNRPEAHAGFSQHGYDNLIEQFEDMDLTPEEEEEESSRLIASAHHVPVDDAGRIVLAKELREQIGITDEAAFVGRASYFEIWNPDSWARHEDRLRERHREGRSRVPMKGLHR